VSTQAQLHTLLTSDALDVLTALMAKIVGSETPIPIVHAVAKPFGIVIEMDGPFGKMRTELYPGLTRSAN